MLFTSLKVLAPPAAEPVSLDLLRAHLRLDQDFDDPLLAAYLAAARENAEVFLGRALVTQTLQWTVSQKSDIQPQRDEWGSQIANFGNPSWPWAATLFSMAIELPRPPIQSIVSFSILDRLGNTTATQQTSASTPSGNALQFSAVGCPAKMGQFVQDLSAPAAIPLGSTVSGVSVANGIATVTLSAPVAGPVGQGDNVLFSSVQSLSPTNGAPAAALALTGGSLYIADLALEPARVRPDWAGAIAALLTVSVPAQHLQFVFTAGYDGAGASVPQKIKQAIMLTAGFFYERRGDEPGEMPPAIQFLLERDRVQSF